jgi:hypothetical protein
VVLGHYCGVLALLLRCSTATPSEGARDCSEDGVLTDPPTGRIR